MKRHSFNQLQPPQSPYYQPPQPSWWNNGLGLGVGGRRNSCVFPVIEDMEDQYYYNASDALQNNNQNIPTIQIETSVAQNGSTLCTTGSSPTHLTPSPEQSFNRNTNNSSIAATRNKLRIMAMLDDVRKKRELRDRRKSDIMAYLDDLTAPDDPALANATGSLKLYRRRFKIYQFLNHPSTSTPWSISYHVMVFIIVFVCLILTICATIAPLQERAKKSVYKLEKVVVIWFNIEFAFGLWSCACKKRYRGLMGKVRYLTVPSRLIDLIILSLTTIVLIFNPSKTDGHEVFVISAFRGFHRFFQVAQVLTLNRPLKPWKVLASVIYDQREQLFIIYYTEFIVLCVLAYIAFLVERDSNENFNSIADAMWWAIVTLSTVGYGDRVPVTWVGKIISTLFTILGVAIFALPAGIIGTGLALKIEEVERNQIKNRKKIAAANLIQRTYRSWKAQRTYELVSKFFRERPMPIYKQHDYLSMAQKFIALVQFLIALNKFRELLRPLDLKTIVQSYSDGQSEVLLRTKLILQSVEELSRKMEMTENRVANMSMRIETKQNTFERRMENIRTVMEHCHRQLLANHLLVELLRTNNNRFNGSTINSNGKKQPSLNRQVLSNSNRQIYLTNNNRSKQSYMGNGNNTNNNNTTTNNKSSQFKAVNSNELSQHQLGKLQLSEAPLPLSLTSSSSSSLQQPNKSSSLLSKQPLLSAIKPNIKSNNQSKRNIFPTNSGSNTSIEDVIIDMVGTNICIQESSFINSQSVYLNRQQNHQAQRNQNRRSKHQLRPRRMSL